MRYLTTSSIAPSSTCIGSSVSVVTLPLRHLITAQLVFDPGYRSTGLDRHPTPVLSHSAPGSCELDYRCVTDNICTSILRVLKAYGIRAPAKNLVDETN